MTQLVYLGSLEKQEDVEAELSNHSIFSCDTETISLKNRTCIGIGLCSGEHRWYFPFDIETGNRHADTISKILTDPTVTKLYHNVNYDYSVLEEALGIQIDWYGIEDSYLLAKNMGIEAGLEAIGTNMLGYTDMFSIQDLFTETGLKSSTMLDVPLERVALKCLNDVRATYYGFDHLYNKASANELENYKVDMDLLPVLRQMERKGLGLNKPKLYEMQDQHFRSWMHKQQVCKELGFNPGSNQQVALYLAQQGCMLPMTRSKKNLSVDEDVLLGVDHPVAKLVLDYRHEQKLLSTYLDPWIGEERAGYHFRSDLSTGRLASYDRNIQNVPPNMRSIFAPDSGTFTWFDYSQIELRVFAYLAHDEVMLEAYKTNADIHNITLTELGLSDRLLAKTFNFAMIYFAKAGTLAAHTKLPYDQCARFRKRWLDTYRGGYQYMLARSQDTKDYAETYFGRKMALPRGDSSYEVEHRNKCRINYPVQGTAADIIKRAMLRCKDLDMRVQVHDELVFDGSIPDTDLAMLDLSSIASDIHTPYEVRRGEVWS